MEENIRSDEIRDLLCHSDDDIECSDSESGPKVYTGLNPVNIEYVPDAIFDSESEGELIDDDRDFDYLVDETRDSSDSENNEIGQDEVYDDIVGLDAQPSTSTQSSTTDSGRPILDSSSRKQLKRKRPSERKKKSTDEELGWVNDDNQPILPEFDDYHSGIKAAIDETSTPIDIFSLFFPDFIFRIFKTETNKYAKSIIDKKRRNNSLKKNSIWGKWTTVKLHEIYLFFSIILHMCVVKKVKLRDYWSTDKFLSNVYAASVMSRDRFMSILANFHISDNSTAIPYNQAGHDPLQKLRPYINHLDKIFPESYYPFENLTVDEGTCGFRGRVRFRVYNKNKPDRYGIKLYIVCDSLTGYVLNMEIYTGKSDDSSVTALYKRLLDKYLNKGHTVYMDRFYSSPTVFDFLWSKNTKAVGTCMRNRKELPQQVVNKKLKKDESVFMRRDHLLCLKWKDKRDVLTLSSVHKNTSSEVTVRSKQGMVPIKKPDLIIDYNKNKTGVDRSDQIIAYYPFKRKQMKWWKKLFFHLFMMSTANAFILYRESRPQNLRKKCHLYDFIVSIGKALGEKGGQLAGEAPSPSTASNRLIGKDR